MSNSSPNFTPEAKDEHKDKLSALSDDILRLILWLMDRKDATRTCILSRSWRYLATYFSDLNFDASQTLLLECIREGKLLEDQIPRFVNWVNQVVSLSRATFVDEFRICFPLNDTHSNYVDDWIKFAISKSVNDLELNFCGNYYLPYTLTSNVLNGVSHLRSLCLNRVKLSAEVIELILSRCHLLERLRIADLQGLLKLLIINSSEKLKYLTLHDCRNLQELEIHAVNLLSFDFKCHTEKTNVVYACAPSLVEVHLDVPYRISGFWDFSSVPRLIPGFARITSIAAHLSMLSLALDIDMIDEDLDVPLFPNVQYLNLDVGVTYDFSNCLRLICFPEACPLLVEFKLKLEGRSSPFDFAELDSDSELEDEYDLEDVKQWMEIQEENCATATLPNLQKLEWASTFSFDIENEYALALYIVKNAFKLETFICHPRNSSIYPYYDGKPVERESIEYAERLALVIPSHVEFVIMK